MASAPSTLMASVSAALFFAVAAFLSNFAAARPGEPFHPCNTISSSGSDSADAPRRSFDFVSNNPAITNLSSSSSDAFDEQSPLLPPDLLENLFEEASHGFWPLLLECVATVLAIAFEIFFSVICGTVIAVFLLFLLRLIWYALFDGDQSPRKTGHVMIPSIEMESAPAKVGYDGN